MNAASTNVRFFGYSHEANARFGRARDMISTTSWERPITYSPIGEAAALLHAV